MPKPLVEIARNGRGAARRWPYEVAAAVVLAAAAFAWMHRTATFSVHSYPVASALVDGADVGRTPLEMSLPAGAHEDVLVRPADCPAH